VKPIFKKDRRNNVEDYREVAILSAIPKRFEFLVYRTMYDDLKNLISISIWLYIEPSHGDELVEVRFFGAEFN
jgi:hypothetical protein